MSFISQSCTWYFIRFGCRGCVCTLASLFDEIRRKPPPHLPPGPLYHDIETCCRNTQLCFYHLLAAIEGNQTLLCDILLTKLFFVCYWNFGLFLFLTKGSVKEGGTWRNKFVERWKEDLNSIMKNLSSLHSGLRTSLDSLELVLDLG